jgi:inward rectifier potassium channel
MQIPNLRNRKDFKELGFGTRVVTNEERTINKDGTFNVRKRGLPFFQHFSIYHDLITMKGSTFIWLIIVFYTLMNFAYAGIYYAIGVEHLGGVGQSTIGPFWEAFFFSCQTFTTVGYGRVNPMGFATNIVAAVESLTGLMAFALATGLLYGRFSRAKADLIFSDNAIIAPYKGINALMFRVAHTKKHVLNNVNAQVTIAMTVDEGNGNIRRFYPLTLELATINFLSLTWTIVHAIDENSPLWGMTEKDLNECNAEIMLLLKGFDDTFSQDVHKRSSYKHYEVVWGAKYVSLLNDIRNGITVLDLSRMNEFDHVELNDIVLVKEAS